MNLDRRKVEFHSSSVSKSRHITTALTTVSSRLFSFTVLINCAHFSVSFNLTGLRRQYPGGGSARLTQTCTTFFPNLSRRRRRRRHKLVTC
jgi:hypothetical protein